MFLKKKKRIVESIDTICQVLEYINETGNIEMLSDVEIAITLILKQLKNEEYNISETINYVENALNFVKELKAKGDNISFDDLNNLLGQISIFEQAFLIQVQVKLNIVFMPYNITMWDSLESIYLACKEDVDCVARVVPIPFFDITQNPTVMHYHLDQYDESIGAIDFRNFDLAAEEPDVIYIHNAYDNGNILTTVHPDYYTENLKKYTDMLVYSPYCVPNFLKQNLKEKHSFTFEVAGYQNIDRFISAGDFVKKEGLDLNFPKEKILNLGSPKFDSLITNITKDFDYPEEWIKKSKGKRVVLFSTSINYFILAVNRDKNRVTNFCNSLGLFERTLQKFQDEDIFVIWRPHPLTRTFISKVDPEFVEWYDSLCDKIKGVNATTIEYNRYKHVVLDENPSFLPAFKFSDAFVTSYTSIIFLYLLLNKKFISTRTKTYFEDFIDLEKYSHKLGFAIKKANNDDFEEEGLFEFFDEYVNFEKTEKTELDTELMSKFYKNLDGTAGEKIHNAVKNDMLK